MGVADLDGDGVAEIAAVTTPHIAGVLRVYRRDGAQLLEVASLTGFSDHVYRTPELEPSRPTEAGGRTQLPVPDTRRASVRGIALEGDQLVETDRCELDVPITGPSALQAFEDRMSGAR